MSSSDPRIQASLPVVDPELSYICRHCLHMARARADGREQCGQDCVGLLSGGSFEKYDGPLSAFTMQLYCFICGADAAHPIIHKVTKRRFGMCEHCFDVVFVPLKEAAQGTPDPKSIAYVNPVEKTGEGT